jgi:hypothetical protein
MLAESLISQGGKTGAGITFLRNDRSDFLAGEAIFGRNVAVLLGLPAQAEGSGDRLPPKMHALGGVSHLLTPETSDSNSGRFVNSDQPAAATAVQLQMARTIK